jgi:3-hydroxyacyl-[acyl-carrier-protein] dehydratase/UDP-3-O-[3-hydroxymyristoyl] N-acetylglucosamine deacetylase/3-hydroxyacyl-[acyl-carrier-protein] dehydratase
VDIHEIQAWLPHRYPFLLVDRVVELTEDKIVALKNVTANEPHFQGHFPGHPIMPGVLIIEAMAQSGGILALTVLNKGGVDTSKKLIFFMGIDKAKFRKPVVPGDQLRLRVVPLRKGGNIWKMRGEAFVGDTLVCEAEFLATLADK